MDHVTGSPTGCPARRSRLSARGELPNGLAERVQEVAAGRRLQRPARAWELPARAAPEDDTPPSAGDAAVGARL